MTEKILIDIKDNWWTNIKKDYPGISEVCVHESNAEDILYFVSFEYEGRTIIIGRTDIL